jgi:signal transduction histidine kinase
LAPLARASEQDAPLSQVLSTVRQAMTNIRRTMMNLYPANLDKYGLLAAIQELAEKLEGHSIDVEIVDHSAQCADKFGRDAQLALYRIVQQAFSNVHKHSGASRVQVVLRQADGKFTLSVSDDGKGMNDAQERQDSYGLKSMRSKAGLIGAEIHWLSPPPQFPTGTEVRLEVPLPEGAGEGE